MSRWPVGERLIQVYDALYLSLAEAASLVTEDAYVVRLHEASRGFGGLALELRGEEDTPPDQLVAELVRGSLAPDATGALALYALSMVIGPRLLVTLRDALEEETDDEHRDRLKRGSDLVLSEILASGRVVSAGAPRDDPQWARAARAIAEALDDAGMAESLGQKP